MGVCNYCTLKMLKRNAEKNDKVITVIGNYVYKHPKNINVRELLPTDREVYMAAWFMALPDHCSC